jgi:hypothetical protein
MLSQNAQKLLEVLKSYVRDDRLILPPLAELQAKMDGLHPVVIRSCLQRLIEQGALVIQ